MPRKLVIAISGQVGAGKTTYAKRLAEEFNLKYVSSGMLFRKIAEEMGVSLLQLHEMAEKDPKYDLMIDKNAIKVAKEGNVVVEGHLAAWVLADIADIKVLLIAPLNVRAERLAQRDGKSFKKSLQEIRKREESNRKRCLKYYGKDTKDWSIFNLIIDTSKLSIDGVYRILREYVRTYIEEHEEER